LFFLLFFFSPPYFFLFFWFPHHFPKSSTTFDFVIPRFPNLACSVRERASERASEESLQANVGNLGMTKSVVLDDLGKIWENVGEPKKKLIQKN